MGLVNPIVGIMISFALLVVLLYKRVNLGITLNVTAIVLALLSLDWLHIPEVFFEASVDPGAVSIVIATFGIMLLSQLYTESGLINKLSESISLLVNNPKVVLSIVPAIIGLLPVAGGALMSAPLVDVESERLRLTPQRKAYINFWFRHTILPVYPLSPSIIATVMFTGVTATVIVLRQIPAVLVMIAVGYITGFRKVKTVREERLITPHKLNSALKDFSVSFIPILVTIIVVVALNISELEMFKHGGDVVAAVFIGLIMLLALSRIRFNTFIKAFRIRGLYGVTLAAYGAFLLRAVIISPEISHVFSSFTANGSGLSNLVLLTVLPAALGALTGSPVSGVALSFPILCGAPPIAANVAGLVFMSTYLGYMLAPTHLCFTLTVDYFKCHLANVYKYAVPPFVATFLAAMVTYLLI